jgi:hypothetical protein
MAEMNSSSSPPLYDRRDSNECSFDCCTLTGIKRLMRAPDVQKCCQIVKALRQTSTFEISSWVDTQSAHIPCKESKRTRQNGTVVARSKNAVKSRQKNCRPLVVQNVFFYPADYLSRTGDSGRSSCVVLFNLFLIQGEGSRESGKEKRKNLNSYRLAAELN